METQKFYSIKDVVAEKLSQAGPQVFDSLVRRLTNEEIDRRTKLSLDALQLLDKLNKELRKLKPDQISYNADHTKASETYSETIHSARQKKETQIANLTDAINLALDKNQFDKLTEIVNKLISESNKDGSNESAIFDLDNPIVANKS